MELFGAIRERKSVRAFRQEPVPKDYLIRLIGAGTAAPSKGNTQIWEFVVVAGKKKKEMDTMLLHLLKTDFIPSMKLGDPDESSRNSEALKKAEARSAKNREDMEKFIAPAGISVEKFMLEGTFTFFNAPVAVLVMVDEVFSKDLPHILSVGAAVENVLLAAVDLGLGACWIGGVWRYTKEIRSFLGITENKRLLSAIAIGYPDTDSPINKFKSGRDNLNGFVRWIGLDGVGS